MRASSNQLLRRSLALLLSCLLLAPASGVGGEPIPLRAGPVTMVFDADNAFLRYVKVGSHEVLRGVNAPIRDQFWGTVAPQVTMVEFDDGGDHFSLVFDAVCQRDEIDFRWRGTLTGSPQGEVEFAFDGVAHSTFMRNRIGFCVLHGPSAAGQSWVVENTQGEKSPGRFPTLISPHQPAKDLRGIAHQVAPGFWAHVRLEGDVFEMEDQRNWTDASFKTYCTPLERPYPARIAAGEKISQKVRLHVEGDAPGDASSDDRVVLTLGDQRTALPRLGLQFSSEESQLTPAQVGLLLDLRLDHLRVNLRPSTDAFAEILRQAAEQARAIGATLHVGLDLDEQPEASLQRLAAEVKTSRPPVSAWLVIDADERLYRLARQHLKPLNGESLIAVGKDTNFVDLNRDRPPADKGEAVWYAINPQIHAVDAASMVETLPIQGDTARSAREFVGDRPLMISPVTLRPQQVAHVASPDQVPSDVDPRQTTLFAAAWTVGSLKYLAEANVASATFYETVGWKGVMELDSVASRPNGFLSQPGQLFPIYHVLRDVGEFAGGQVRQLDCSDTLSVVGLALVKSEQMRVIIANLSDKPREVSLRGLGQPKSTQMFYQLDQAPDDEGGQAPSQSAPPTAAPPDRLTLPPFAIARLDYAVAP